jgi:hypothetical protein
MITDARRLIDKIWSYAHVPRHDTSGGLSRSSSDSSRSQVITREIVEDLTAALEEFAAVAVALEGRAQVER